MRTVYRNAHRRCRSTNPTWRSATPTPMTAHWTVRHPGGGPSAPGAAPTRPLPTPTCWSMLGVEPEIGRPGSPSPLTVDGPYSAGRRCDRHLYPRSAGGTMTSAMAVQLHQHLGEPGGRHSGQGGSQCHCPPRMAPLPHGPECNAGKPFYDICERHPDSESGRTAATPWVTRQASCASVSTGAIPIPSWRTPWMLEGLLC